MSKDNIPDPKIWGPTVPGLVTIGGINIGSTERLESPYIDELQREIRNAVIKYVRKYKLPVDAVNVYLNMRNFDRRNYMFTQFDMIKEEDSD